jgi:hypothetical protein
MLRGHSPAFLGTTALIFGFCGLMTTLLVRSILFPENSQLATASPQAICELFASRSEGTDMDIYEGDTITGQCRITPLSGPPIPSRRLESVRVALNGTLQLRGPFASFGQLAFNSRFDLSVSGDVTSFDLNLRLPKADPPIDLRIDQPKGAAWPAITLTRGTTIAFTSNSGAEPDAATKSLLLWLSSTLGINPDQLATLTNPPTGSPPASASLSARGGRITVANSSTDGFILARSDSGSNRAFRLYIASTGEILRIETPSSFNLLSDSFRPPDIAPPHTTTPTTAPPPP